MSSYSTKERTEEINKRFQFVPKANENQIDRYSNIREEAELFALYLAERCPESREFSIALTALEDSVMWAINSIARNE